MRSLFRDFGALLSYNDSLLSYNDSLLSYNDSLFRVMPGIA
jgi:hypothetical protein